MDSAVPTQMMPTSQLLARRRTAVRFAPDAAQRKAIAALLGLVELPELAFEAEVEPAGRGDLGLRGRLRARAVQACIVTLAPVPARIDAAVERRYLAEWAEPVGDEAETPADDSEEPLPAQIDFAGLAIEALALALPEYPRAPGAELGAAEFPAAPVAAAPAETARPLAGLAALLARKTDTDGR